MHAIRRTRNSGFTLVEILIVVIILGILAAIVIPQFTNASQDARRSSLASSVQTLRSQISLYKLQHHDTPPDSSTSAKFWDALTLYTDDTGATSATKTGAFIHGPYVQTIPSNAMVPDADKDVVTVVTSAPTAPGATAAATGYWFEVASGKVWAQGKDDDGLYIIIGE